MRYGLNHGSQVRRSERQEERLYSASLTPVDLDNFLSHSCDPLCVLSVDEEFTVRVVTRRAIAPLEPISIDYERASSPFAPPQPLTLWSRAGGGYGCAGG